MLIFDYFVSQKTPMTTNYTIQFIRGKLALDHTTNLSLVHLSTILQMKNRYERMIIVYLNSYEHMIQVVTLPVGVQVETDLDSNL